MLGGTGATNQEVFWLSTTPSTADTDKIQHVVSGAALQHLKNNHGLCYFFCYVCFSRPFFVLGAAIGDDISAFIFPWRLETGGFGVGTNNTLLSD